MSDVFATAADAAYGYHAVNLIGSVKANSDLFDRIEVFDLGLTAHQLRLLRAVPSVVVRDVPAFAPHWAQCFTWKPWAWQQLDADRVFWLDAGASVLRSLRPALDQIGELGYFFVSQGNQLGDIVPPDYFERYELSPTYASRPYVAAGILGFCPDGEVFEQVLTRTYEDCLAGQNLGFSAAELPHKNRGLGLMHDPPVRECAHFRWDQTILNIHLAKRCPDALVADLDQYAGWRSPRDHPRQVIWNHRRRGNLGYLSRVPYAGRARIDGTWFGACYRFRWWLRLHDKYLRRSTYVLKARRILGIGAGRG